MGNHYECPICGTAGGWCNHHSLDIQNYQNKEFEMAKEKYYMLTLSEDGEKHLYVYTKQQLDRELAERLRNEENFTVDEFLSEIPADLDYIGGKSIIFKGEIVVPKIKARITTVEI